jgi:prophage antirepressor-like protein
LSEKYLLFQSFFIIFVAVVGSFDKPQFVVKDICNILGISNVTMAVRSIPEEWRGELNQIEDSSGHKQHMLTVYEPGLYHLIMRSDKPVAKQFQKWTFEDVLPSIRKKGEYVLEEYKKKLEEQQKALEEKTREAEDQQKALEEKTNLLEIKEKRIDHLESKVLRCRPQDNSIERNCIYIMTSRYHLPERLYLIGKATTVKNRKSQYDKVVNHEVVYKRPCNSARQMALIENMVLMKLSKYREVSNIDRFHLPEDKDISFFTNVVDFFVDSLADVQPGFECNLELTEEQKDEKLKQYKKEYSEDHKEEIKEHKKVYQEENREAIKECKKEYSKTHKEEIKIYKLENKEAISEKEKEYREKNKEKIAEKNKKWREKNKEKVSEYNKKYNEEHREEIAERHKNYLAENSEDIKVFAEENKETISEKKKIYRLEHIDQEIERHKKYYEENKEDIKEKTKAYREEQKNKKKPQEKIVCECGIKLTKACINRHKASEIHKILLNKKQTEITV